MSHGPDQQVADPEAGHEREEWRKLGQLLRRLARGEDGAMDDLNAMADRSDVSRPVAVAAEHLGLLLMRMEGKDFLLTAAAETEERLRDLNELKNRHLGIAAHDLRNPLGTIRGLAKFLTRKELEGEKQRSFASSIVRISDEMLSLLETLLDVAVIESGRLDLDRTPGNLAELTRDRAERAAVSAGKKDIAVKIRTASAPDTMFDPARMGQVLENLLSNAVKFSPRGTTVNVECAVDGEEIAITVSDEGPGIPENELRDIFDAYGRSNVRPTAGEKSTGLGLSIVKPIIVEHGGVVTVDSTVGKGTTFTIQMPIDEPGPAPG